MVVSATHPGEFACPGVLARVVVPMCMSMGDGPHAGQRPDHREQRGTTP